MLKLIERKKEKNSKDEKVGIGIGRIFHVVLCFDNFKQNFHEHMTNYPKVSIHIYLK
jgi:hypothetical protein